MENKEGKLSVSADDQLHALDNSDQMRDKANELNDKTSAPAPEGTVVKRTIGTVSSSTAMGNNTNWYDHDKDEIETALSEIHGNVDEEMIETEEQEKTRKRLQKKQEDEECLNYWKSMNNYGNRYNTPVPKHLIISNISNRKYSKENVMNRTAWIGKELEIVDRTKLPNMKKIFIKGEECIAVTIEDPEVAKKLMTKTKIGPFKVKIERDSKKDSVVGVFKDRDEHLVSLTEEQILETIKNQGARKVINIKRGRNKEPTLSYKVIFDGQLCPDSIDISKVWFPVREFVPPPLRCFKCQKYGHQVRNCRAEEDICQKCGGEGHTKLTFRDDEPPIVCPNQKKCANCNEKHEAGDPDCKDHQGWTTVQKLIVHQKLSRYEAKSRVFPETRSNRTDAQVVKAADRIQNVQIEENRAGVQALHEKLDRLLEASNDRTDDKQTEYISKQNIEKMLEEKMTQACAIFQKQLDDQKKESDMKYDKIQQQLNEQKKKVEVLTREKSELKEETIDLKKKLKEAYESNKKLTKELQNSDSHKEKSSRKREPSSDLIKIDHNKKITPNTPPGKNRQTTIRAPTTSTNTTNNKSAPHKQPQNSHKIGKTLSRQNTQQRLTQ